MVGKHEDLFSELHRMVFLHVKLKNDDKKYNIKIDPNLVLTTNATLTLFVCFIQ